jgi:hypothetical protein
MVVVGFLESWGRSLFNWFGFVFTVLGAIIGLALAREHWWISVLIVIATVAASGSFAYFAHSDRETAARRHQKQVSVLHAELGAAAGRLQDAERMLNEVPYELLSNLACMCASYSLSKSARLLVERVDFVARMVSFAQISAKPINLRSFVRQGGGLYVVAKAESKALQQLKRGDPFLLVKKSSEGLATPCARLVVHQPPDQAKGVVMFHICDYLSDEMGHLENLASSGNVEGIKGFGVQMIPDVTSYGNLDLTNLVQVVSRIVRDIEEEVEGVR